MSLPRIPRIVLTLLPAALLAAVAASAIWGESGLLSRYELRADLAAANAELAGVERENQRLVRDLVILDRDPRALERAVADELEWARPGSTVYRFDAPPGNHPAP